MNDIVIVEAVRTPVGRFRGSLAGVRADHLGSLVINELLRRTGLSADKVDDVIFGCVTQIGEQSANIARTALLGAGWPSTVPGLTLDRKCGSGEADGKPQSNTNLRRKAKRQSASLKSGRSAAKSWTPTLWKVIDVQRQLSPLGISIKRLFLCR